MKRFKKIICLFTVLVLLSACASSCDDRSDTSDNNKLDTKMIYNRALVRINNAKSYVREDTYRTEITQNGQLTVNEQSFVDKYSFDGIGKDSVSYTFTDAVYGPFTLTFCENLGYVSTETSAFSFDCTSDEFFDLVQRYMYVAGFVTNINVFSMFSYDAVCEMNEQGYYFISVSRLVFDENTKEILLGSGYEFYTEISGLNLEATIIINPQLCFEEILTDITFSANTETGKADFNIHNKISFSEIDSKTLYIDIPSHNCEHIGSVDVLAGIDAFANLNCLSGYSANLTGEYSLSGEDIVHNDFIAADFVVEEDETQKFALKSVYDCDGVQRTYHLYFADGVLYSKYDDVLNYTDYGKEAGRYDSLSLWTDPFFAINAGKTFTLADNGNGTATLTYEYDERLIKQIINNYFFNFYDIREIPAVGDVLSVEKAVAFVTYDTAKLIVIEQTYEIEVTVEIEGKTFVYTEKRHITVSADDFTVPEKDVFLGTSEL